MSDEMKDGQIFQYHKRLRLCSTRWWRRRCLCSHHSTSALRHSRP